MIVTKDLQVDMRGEPLFEKVNIVIRAGERIGVLGPKASDVTLFFHVLVGEAETDAGKVLTEGERVVYVDRDTLLGGDESLARVMHARPTFLLIDATNLTASANDLERAKRFIESFRGGILIATDTALLMNAAKTTRVFEIRPSTKTITSYTGSYAAYLIEKEKNDAKELAAYEKQQKEKRRLEDWLTNKRIEASNDRSPEKGATIRTKAKYLQREILDKEIPKPSQSE
ncbi:MAG: transporter, ATP-binding protein [Parcubacteria group bacterium]|nr:transporter, ATP-binding protein [Parcubacteria group bacterium]